MRRGRKRDQSNNLRFQIRETISSAYFSQKRNHNSPIPIISEHELMISRYYKMPMCEESAILLNCKRASYRTSSRSYVPQVIRVPPLERSASTFLRNCGRLVSPIFARGCTTVASNQIKNKEHKGCHQSKQKTLNAKYHMSNVIRSLRRRQIKSHRMHSFLHGPFARSA